MAAVAPTEAQRLYLVAFAAGWEAQSPMSVSECADAHRWLPRGTGPEPGKWHTERTPYLREIMDVLSPSHLARRIVLMKGSRMGGTEAGNNWVLHAILSAPASFIMALPSQRDARAAMLERLGPMVDSCPELAARILDATALRLRFPGGQLNLVHASSGKQLRARTGRCIFCDEIDAWDRELPGEGSPLEIIEKRATGYSGAKIFYVSTPTETGFSAIEELYLSSDQRRFLLPCPDCAHPDFLTWSGYRDHVHRVDPGHYRIEWDQDQPETARCVCGRCGIRIPEPYKHEWLARGRWQPLAAGDGQTIGFHLSSLYAPYGWLSWAELAREFLRASRDVSALRPFVNTRLGETFEEKLAGASSASLKGGLERYPAEVPSGVGVLVAGVDVHADRLEAQAVGFGADEESWLVAWQVFMGDPTKADAWRELDRFLLRRFRHQSGQQLAIERVCVDSGFLADHVYRFTKPREERELAGAGIQQVFAVRGGQLVGRPVVERPSRNNRYSAVLFTLCVDTAKDELYARLRMDRTNPGGPGYMHLPDWLDEEYLEQLAAEKKIPKRIGRSRRIRRVWEKIRDRNEAVDLTVYSLAALRIMGPDFIRSLGARAAAFAQKPEEAAAPAPAAPPQPPARRPRDWIMGFRRR
jgi:phage terminase large subunit GpA-like protein